MFFCQALPLQLRLEALLPCRKHSSAEPGRASEDEGLAGEAFLSQQAVQLVRRITSSYMLVAILYLILAGAYLLVVPFAVLLYLKQRWYVASSFERGFMYFLVFFFFPGLLLLGPFVNYRPQRRQVES